MRRLSLDQVEFEHWESEESLDIAVARREEEFTDPQTFLVACREKDAPSARLGAPAALSRFARLDVVRAWLSRYPTFANVAVEDWNCSVVHDGWNLLELVLTGPEEFVWLRWMTTA